MVNPEMVTDVVAGAAVGELGPLTLPSPMTMLLVCEL